MSAKKPDWSRAVARRIGLPGEMEFLENPMRPGLTMHVACERGNHVVDVKVRAHDHPDYIVKRMLQAGWTIGSNPVCPDCSRKRKVTAMARPLENRQEIAAELMKRMGAGETPAEIQKAMNMSPGTFYRLKEEAANEKEPPVSSIPPPLTASDQARAARREALEWLSESFDTATGTYKAGVSDDSISKETGIAIKAVAELREEFYGPLREHPEIAELRAILNDVQKQMTSLRDGFLADFGALNTRAANAAERIEALVRKNGWAG